MSTPFVPLQAIQAWYDTEEATVPISVYLLDATVTSLLDSYETVADLPGLLPTTGDYDATHGLDAGAWPLFYDTTAGVLELSLPDVDWGSTENLDLTFRWAVFAMADGTLLTAVDFGAAQTLTGEPLRLAAAESSYIPNSYPVLRWRKA